MKINAGETLTLPVSGKTISGIKVNVILFGATVNTAINAADFVPSQMLFKTILNRNGVNKTITQQNLNTLQVFSAKNYSNQLAFYGVQRRFEAADATPVLQLSFLIPFGGCINLKGNDLLTIECQMGLSVFSTDLNTTASFAEFTPHFDIGYEWGTPAINSTVIQENADNADIMLGAHVGKILLLNLNKTSLLEPVVTQVNLQSKEINASYNQFDLVNIDRNAYVDPVVQYRTANNMTAGATVTVPYNPLYPQSFYLYAPEKGRQQMLSSASVYLTFDSAQVAASQNYLVWHSFEVTKEIIARASERQNKHAIENIQSLKNS